MWLCLPTLVWPALAGAPHLNLELVGAWNPNPPPRVPAVDRTQAFADLGVESAYPVRMALGYARDELFVQVRRETMLGAWDAYAPRTYDVRIGRIDNARGGSWGARQALHSYADIVAPFVGYRAVTDMYTEGSFLMLEGSERVSDGHGVEGGLYFGQPEQGIWSEFALVYYAVGWPSEDRSRLGLLTRGGVAIGPLLGGVRFDLDPGTGAYAAVELGLGGFVNVSPADWARP